MLNLMNTLGNNYFSAMHCMFLGLAQEGHEASVAASALQIPRMASASYREEYEAYERHANTQSNNLAYQTFVYVYLLSYLQAIPSADIIINIDKLSNNQHSQEWTEGRIFSLTGMTVTLSDAKIRTHPVPELNVDFSGTEREVLCRLRPLIEKEFPFASPWLDQILDSHGYFSLLDMLGCGCDSS